MKHSPVLIVILALSFFGSELGSLAQERSEDNGCGLCIANACSGRAGFPR